MNQDNPSDRDSPTHGSFWRSRAGLALIVFLAVGALLLGYEHRVHVFSSDGLLIGLLIACLAMHLFMHRGHGGHGGGGPPGGGGSS